MENTFSKEYMILTSSCDAEGKLGVRNLLDIFMDMASVHASRLGVGYYDMLKQHCYWVAVRTRVKIYERPALEQTVTATTWPGKPGLVKMDRFYQMTRDGRVLADGRTEWGVQDIDTGAVRRSDSFGYPADLAYREERVCAEPYTRFRDMDTSDMKPVRVCTVDPMDIDLGRHMNNVAYIRMLLGTFSTAEQAEMDLSELEISYRRACFEGETLSVYRRQENSVWKLQVQKENGETAVHALFRCREKTGSAGAEG